MCAFLSERVFSVSRVYLGVALLGCVVSVFKCQHWRVSVAELPPSQRVCGRVASP